MISYEILHWCVALLTLSMLGLLYGFTEKGGTAALVFRIWNGVFLAGSILVLVLLFLNREAAFHWHYDVATGEPVDHYSTFLPCVWMAGASAAAALIGLLAGLWRKRLGKRA